MKYLFLGIRLLITLLQQAGNLLTLGNWPPFAGVAVVIRRDDQVLFLRRRDGKGFGLPGGFIQINESAEQAAIRETLEETGFEVELTGLLGVLSGKRGSTWVRTVDTVFEGRILRGEQQDSVEGECVWAVPANVQSEIAFNYDQLLLNQQPFPVRA